MGKSDFVKKFDDIFKSKFNKLNQEDLNALIENTKQKLELKDIQHFNLLLILSYSYLDQKGFTIENEKSVESLSQEVLVELKNAFKQGLISEPSNEEFLLIVTKKTSREVDGDDIEKLAKVYNGSDIIFINKKLKRICYTRGDAKKYIDKLIKEEKLIVAPTEARRITFHPFDKILTSRGLDIFEVEFRSVNLPSLKGMYIKAGSKLDKINQKISTITQVMLEKNVLRASHIKSIHLGLKGCNRKESATIIVTNQKRYGVYKIKWKSRAVEELDCYIREIGLKDLFDVEVMDENIPHIERVLDYFIYKRKISREEYQVFIEPYLRSWDKYNLLKYELGSLKPNYNSLNLLINELESDYHISYDFKIKLNSKINKKGILLKDKENGKETFVYLNKSNSAKDIDAMITSQKPILIIDFATYLKDQPKRFNFLRINDENITGFKNKIRDIGNYGKFYRNQKARFFKIGTKLDNIYKELEKKKTSQSKGALWETVCEDLLDFVFNRSFPLSGPNFPDGVTYWTSGNDIFLWDAKALRKLSLKKSILTKNNVPKDPAYVKILGKKRKVDYYVFLSCGVNKSQFEEAKELLKKYEDKVKFSCITDSALRDLKELFKDDNRASMLHKNSTLFVLNFKKILDNGFVDSIKMEDLTNGMENKDEIDSKAMRAEVKELVSKLPPVNTLNSNSS